MRICLIYDCLFPYTVGGAERWYRNLAERLAEAGHQVTYLTLRQWEEGEKPELPGIKIVEVGPRMSLYVGGRRRLWPPLRFGLGVLIHLLRRGGSYDVVHTCSFPYFSVLAAAAARRVHRYRLVIDWFEIWTKEYWTGYLGPVGGRVGWLVQKACIRLKQQAFCFSRLAQGRLKECGLAGQATVLPGLYPGSLSSSQKACSVKRTTVVYAGRHIPEKRVPDLVRAFERVHRELPELTCTVFGDGPERSEVDRLIETLGLDGTVRAPGFVSPETVDEAISSALCLVLPSEREGYGLVVVEALAHGTPCVVVAGPDNAAVELIEEGKNGYVAASVEPEDLATAIARTYREQERLLESTVKWFTAHQRRLSIENSLQTVVDAYQTTGH